VDFVKKPATPASELATKAKAFVDEHPLFTPQQQALGLAEIPFNDKMAGWMWKKNVQTMPVLRFAVEFFLGLYLRDVVMKRAPGTDGFDSMTGAPTRLCAQAKHTVWCSKMLYVVQRNLVFLDQFMFTYLCAATAGELRHSPSRAKSVPKSLLEKWQIVVGGNVTSRTVTQARFLKHLDVSGSAVYLDDADHMFRDFSWAGAYGGKKWADICKTGRERAKQETDPVLFVDRVFDLKHNGGPMFDKNSIITQHKLPQFLDAKFQLKTDQAWNDWLPHITKEMAEVLEVGAACGLWEGGMPAAVKLNKMPPTLEPVEGKATGHANLDEIPETNHHHSPHVADTPSFKLGDLSCPNGVKHE
jgi:hypothetical protein